MTRNFNVSGYKFGPGGYEPSFILEHGSFYKSLKTEKRKLGACSISILEEIARLDSKKISKELEKVVCPVREPKKKSFSLNELYYLVDSGISVLGPDNKMKIENQSCSSIIKLSSNLVLNLTLQKKNIFLMKQIAFGGDELFEEIYELFGGKWK